MTLYLGNAPIAGGVKVDQTYDGTSANAQSGVAIAGAGFLTATESKSGDGYVKFSNGIIIQWGSLSGGTTTETLPTPFTTTDYKVVLVASPSNASATYNAVLDGDSLTTTSFSIGVSSNVSVRWIAIGW